MEKWESLDEKYRGAPICWGVIDVIQQFIENKSGKTPTITIEEIQRRIVGCTFQQQGMPPELHQILAVTDPDFVKYVYECAKSELESTGFKFDMTGLGRWKVIKPSQT